MRQKTSLILFCIFAFGFTNLTAQTQTDKTEMKTISRGVVNGVALTLVKPAYPPAAKAVRAEGTVSVQVTIDEEGNVIDAKAVSGHPLLRAASVEAAQQSKFKPTVLEGQPVKVTGIIVYNFVGPTSPLTIRQIGYALSLAENSMWWKASSPDEISTSLSFEWIDEKELLKNLATELKNKELEKEKPQPPAPTIMQNGKIVTGEKFKIGSENVTSGSYVRGSAPSVYYKPLDAGSLGKVRELQAKIENRLLTEEKNLWSFRFGKLLGKTKAELHDADKTRLNLLELNQMAQVSPEQFSESVLLKIREVSDSFQQAASIAETKKNLETLIENLSK